MTRDASGDGPLRAEPEPRYFVADGLIGVTTRRLYVRTLRGMALWLGAPPAVAACLGCLKARRAMHGVERWWARRVVRHLGIRLEIAGLEHIAPDARYIVAPLHEGFADILALLHLPLQLRFAARDELFGWRFLARYLCAAGRLRVSPEQGSRGYRRLRQAATSVFAAEESLVIFPQGTILGIETEFAPGAFALARATQRPLLPIALTGSHLVWEHPFSPRLRYGQRISMCVLPPMLPEVFCDQDLNVIRQEVQRSLKAVALGGQMAPPRRFVPERDGYWEGYAYGIDPAFPALAEQVARYRRAHHHAHIAVALA